MVRSRILRWLPLVAVCAWLATQGGCSAPAAAPGGGGNTPSTYTVGGTVSGLTGDGLVVQNSGADDLAISAGASTFTFPTSLSNSAVYAVTVKTQASGEVCAVSAGSGTVSGANVSNVAIDCSGGAWTTLASMPTPRSDLGLAEVNGILYAIGGCCPGGHVSAVVEAYDPATDTWSAKTSMPTARDLRKVAVVNGKIYAIGGKDDSDADVATVEAYDPATNAWTAKASMPTARTAPSIAVVNGIIYAIGGDPGLTVVEAYDPVANSWSTKASLPIGEGSVGEGVKDGIIYIFGYTSDFSSSHVQAYDTATNTWSTVASAPLLAVNPGAAFLDGSFYVAGGYAGSLATFPTGVSAVQSVLVYDPVADAWDTRSDMSVARGELGAVTLNGRIYAAGGEPDLVAGSSSNVGTLEAYTPPAPADANTWATKSAMPAAVGKFDLGAAAVNGVIYTFGGFEGGGLVGPVGAYTPATDTWTQKASLPTPRDIRSVSEVNGLIYVIGGADDSDTPTTVNEVYHPATNSWTSGAAMTTARSTATSVAVNGIVYMIGGFDGSGTDLTAVEAYNPATNAWSTKASLPVAVSSGAAAAVNGKVYVFAPDGSVQTYNPVADAWSTAASMPTAVGAPVAVTLDGLIYVIGGYLVSCGTYPDCLTSADLVQVYDPRTNTWSTRQTLPKARGELTAVALNGAIYAIGGLKLDAGVEDTAYVPGMDKFIPLPTAY